MTLANGFRVIFTRRFWRVAASHLAAIAVWGGLAFTLTGRSALSQLEPDDPPTE